MSANPLQSVKLGQSLFQDTFFVANSQLTPFRKLRQLELELQELDTAIKKANIQLKRLAIKKRDLNPDDELESLELEELAIDETNTKRLLSDACDRRDNFLKMKEQLLEEVPQEYWNQGFENAELQYWTKHFAKQLSIAMITGIPNPQLVDQMTVLPVDMVKSIMIEAKQGANQLALIDKYTEEAL